MKKIVFAVSLFTSMLVNTDSNAQQSFGCVIPPKRTSAKVAMPVNCGKTSTAYVSKYGRLAPYVPVVNYTPTKTIKIALHIFQNANGGENYHNTAADIKRLTDIVDLMNIKMANLSDPSDLCYLSDGVTPVTSLKNTTIQYELAGRIYFYHDAQSQVINKVAAEDDSPFKNYISANFPANLSTSVLPIFVYAGSIKNNTTGAIGFAYPGLPTENLAQEQSVCTFFGAYAEGGQADWNFYQHLLHEMGHNLGLSHTFEGLQYTLDPDYLSDVYETSWKNYCNPPANYTCPHARNGSPTDPSVYATNNFMGYSSAEYVSPKQIGSMNRSLAIKNVRRYVKEMNSSTNTWTVSSNETWDFDIQMYQDILVTNNATLTITCKTAMANNGKITVNAGSTLIIDAGTVTSWGSMWGGIVVNAGGNVIVRNGGLIENADTGINSKNGGAFTIQDSKLNKNYRGLYIESYAGTHPGVIKNSTISCVDASGNPVNITLNPRAGARSFSGIEVLNVNQINIGTAVAGQGNTFDNLQMGVTGFNSGLTVYNNTFKRINYASSTNNGRCIETYVSDATERKLTVGGTAANQKNTFIDSYTGVMTNVNQDVNIVGNTFTNLNLGVSVNSCNKAGNSVYVLSNTLNDCNTGISSTDNGGGTWMEVSNNTINPTGVAKPNSKAISITNTSLNTSGTLPTFNILNNTIKNSSTGIETSNYTAPNIKNNTITTSDLGYGVTVQGIIVSSCPSTNLESNLVKGPSASAQTYWWMNGIRLESSTNSKVIYNAAEYIGRGLFFGGSSAGTQVAKNNMKNNSDGLFLNWALIGYQLGSAGACKATENKWTGTVPKGGSNIYSYNSNGTQSPINILPSTNSAWVPEMKTPTNIVSISNTTGGSVYPVPVSTCNTLSGYTGTNRKEAINYNVEQLLNIAQDKIDFAINDASTKWWSKYNLYNEMQTEVALQSESGLQSFATNYKTSNIGTIYKINQSIENGDLATAKNLVSNLNATNTIEQYLKDVYAISIAYRNSKEAISNADVKTLQAIAKLCPYESGPAVYNARALLTRVESTVYFNSCETPGAHSSSIETTNTVISPLADGGIILYPNPANDELHIATHMEAGQTGQLAVYDVTGKLMLSKELNGNTTNVEISTAGLSEGIYLYKLSVNNTEVKSGKLSIIR